MARTFSLVGWDEYQHYGKRKSVPWVKLHRDTLTSLAWIKGDEKARIVMVGSMALAARYQNAIPLDWELLKNGLALKWTEEQFMQALRYLVASKFIALSEHDDSAMLLQEEKSRSEEDEDEIPPKSPRGEADERIDDLFKAYPPRGKAANPRSKALKALKAALARGAKMDDLIRLAPTAAPAEKHGTEFVPMLSTWLNEDRWKDDPASPTLVPQQAPFKPTLDQWRSATRAYVARKFWPSLYGPEPGYSGCECPREILAEFGLDQDAMRRPLTMAG